VTDWVAVLFQDPTLGLPTTLLVGTIAGWLLARVTDRPESTRRPTERPIADRDPVSRTYRAFESGVFSDVLYRALGRLDRLSERRFGRAVARLPRTPWALRQMAPAERSEVRAIRRLRARVDRLLAMTVRREAGIWFHVDFWRSRAELRRRFRVRIAPVLDEVADRTASVSVA